MKEAKDVTAFVWDHGFCVDHAVRLAREYKRVLYYNGWPVQYPAINTKGIGTGMEGIEVVDSPFDWFRGKKFDQVDVWIFPWLYDGAAQVWLAEQGKPVWGCKKGDKMELDRIALKRHLAKIGLPVAPYEAIQGISNLRSYLKDHPDVWVKTAHRGTWESSRSPRYRVFKGVLDSLESDIGELGEEMEFAVEQPVEAAGEAGYDGYTIIGQFPKFHMRGLEGKDAWYVGMFGSSESDPKQFKEINDALAPTLKRYGYQGFLSMEERILKDGTAYLTDVTTRRPSPPGELQDEMFTNMPDIIWQGANGNLIDPEKKAKYGAQLIMKSPWSDKHCESIWFPQEIREYVKLANAVKSGDRYDVIPQPIPAQQVGSVLGFGDTMDESIKQCVKHAKMVEGTDLKIDCDSLESCSKQEIEKLKSGGIDLFAS